MVYTALEIVLFMVLAGLLGFGAGWFLQRARRVEVIVSEPVGQRISTHAVPTTLPPGDTVDLRALESDEEAAILAARAAVRDRMAGTAAGVDDLTRIHGIGPKISDLLVAMGITSYQQIASLSEDDIELVGTALGRFATRIRRDDWVGSARALVVAGAPRGV